MILVGTFFALTATWAMLQLLTGLLLGQQVTLVSLGFGPGLRVTPRLKLALLPGAFVQFEPERLARLSFPGFAVLNLLPWLVPGLVVWLLGATAEDFGRGLTLLARVPETCGHWGAWNEALRTDPFHAVPRLGARLVALNLLPLAPFASGQLLSRLLSERGRTTFTLATFIVTALVVIFGFVR